MARQRLLRVQEAIQEEVSDIMRKELKDPRVGFASVTGVEVTEDYRHARVFISVLGTEEERVRTLEGLERAAGFIRSELGRRLRLRFAPEVVFAPDRSIAHGDLVSRLLAQAQVEASPEVVRELDRQAVVDFLREHDRFVLLLHVRPDGDSIGSSLALSLGLQKLGKTAVLARADDLPDNMRFLPGIDQVVHWQDVLASGGRYDAAILVDCSDPGRVGPSGELLQRAGHVINLDHHVSNTRFGDLNYIEPTAAAAGEVVNSILRDLGVDLDHRIATALYTAIVTDTGSFKYENTSADTHDLVADLIRHGVRPGEASRAIWDNRPVAALRLVGHALRSLGISDDGRLAWITLSREDFTQCGARVLDGEGIVNYPRVVAGVEVAALFIEEVGPSGEDAAGEREVKVSLRSNRWVDVSSVAAAFGGGGHARAAGCTVRGTLAEVREQVLARAGEALAAGEPAGAETPRA